MVNHSLAAKLATDLLLLRSLDRLFSYRKFISSFSLSGTKNAFSLFLLISCCFATLLNMIEAFFYSSLKLNFVPDGIVLCLSHLFAS